MARQFVILATLVALFALGTAVSASISMHKPTRKLANMPQVFDFSNGIDLSADPPESSSSSSTADGPSSSSSADGPSGSDTNIQADAIPAIATGAIQGDPGSASTST